MDQQTVATSRWVAGQLKPATRQRSTWHGLCEQTTETAGRPRNQTRAEQGLRVAGPIGKGSSSPGRNSYEYWPFTIFPNCMSRP